MGMNENDMYASQNLKRDEAIGLFKTKPLSDKEFYAFKELVYNRLGINLTEQKRTLLAGRLQKVLRQRGFSTYYDYYKFLVADETNEALSELADRISTNHTYFFRESEHFEFFTKTALPEAVEKHAAKNDYDLRIWCAGCASGEEPYSLVMLMLEFFNIRMSNWNAGILATDISSKALDMAKAGLYPEERLSAMPDDMRNKYFRQQPDGQWLIRNSVKEHVTFRRFNLMNATFPFKKKFDIIFCRNVMIYFDDETRDKLTDKFSQWLVPDGYLFIGHSETLRWNRDVFNYIMPAVYQKRGG